MKEKNFTIAALGCTGHITEIFMDSFLDQGINLRILARNKETVSVRYPDAEVIQGSMMNAKDTTWIMEGVDAAFLVTPMGIRNDISIEIEAAKAAIIGARAAKLKHLVYVSVLGVDKPVGVPLLDAKHEIENLLADSGIPWTSIRCGSYMEDVFNTQLSAIKRGFFPFPVSKDKRFTYTSQMDLVPFIVNELLPKGALNRSFNFVSPKTYAITEVEELLTKARGSRVRATGKFPLYYILMSMKPIFHLTGHRFSTILPLIRYFDNYGYTATGDTVHDLFPKFSMTSLEDHFQKFWP